MRAQTLVIGTIIGLWMAPLGTAAGTGAAPNEEARLLARLNWQRARIEQLQAEIRALSSADPAAAAVPGDEALRTGLTADELRVARGEPDYVSRMNARCEIWAYGTTRVMVMSGRVTSWQTGPAQVATPPAASLTSVGDPTLADEEQPSPRSHP
jgi:hypothetical protein